MLDGERNLKHKAMLMLAYGCGLRLGEIHGLQVGFVNFDENLVYPFGKGCKQRQVPLPAMLKPILSKFCINREISRPAFINDYDGGQLCDRTVQKVFENACERAGIQRQGGIHSLRHTFATHMLDAGYSLRVIQELMGHASSKTTEIYTHVSVQLIQSVKSPLDTVQVAVG
jgi:site-specific recombinase XerD